MLMSTAALSGALEGPPSGPQGKRDAAAASGVKLKTDTGAQVSSATEARASSGAHAAGAGTCCNMLPLMSLPAKAQMIVWTEPLVDADQNVIRKAV